jgi:mRNA interferase RelE/StbE
LAWTVSFEPRAEKELGKLDRSMQKRIVSFLRDRVEGGSDPRSSGKPLRGEKADLWRYRVGDYRIICRIQDAYLMVLVVRVGHRKDVYR